MFVNHLLFTLRNRIHFSPPSQIFNQTLQVLQTPDGADYTDSFFRNRGMRRTRQTKVLLILQRATALNFFFPLPLCTAKIFHKTWLKFQRSPFSSRYSEVEENLIAESIQKWVRFFLSFLYSTPLPFPHVYAKPLHLQICGFLILWNSGISRERGEYANSQMEGC